MISTLLEKLKIIKDTAYYYDLTVKVVEVTPREYKQALAEAVIGCTYLVNEANLSYFGIKIIEGKCESCGK